MRFVVLLSFVLVLGVLSSDLKVTDSVSSFLASKHEKVKVRASQQNQLKAEKDNFVMGWSEQGVDGYRIATFDEITTQEFVDQYNNQGIFFDLDVEDDEDLKCSLSVADGLLLFPKNATLSSNSNLMTLYDDSNNVGCSLVGSNGYAHFETWPSSFCSYRYVGNQFNSLSVSFMKHNFYTATKKCDDDETSITMAIFIRDPVTPSPSPTPIPTPPPTPSSSYVCCSYFDFSEQFETAFCQVSGQNCPNSIGSYTGVGNYTVHDCKDCCNTIYTKK